jgi:hypothetical protein
MKRDMDLIRTILQKVESCEDPWGLHETLDIEGYNQNEISYHIKLLHEAGLLNAQEVSEMGPDGFRWWPGSLTWAGQDFLNAAKDDSLWKKAKETVIKPGASFTFDLLLAWLKAQVTTTLGIP